LAPSSNLLLLLSGLQAAARRLIGYWRYRKSCFGADKAFLPMTIDGAMQDDVDVLQKGIIHTLPDDEHGRAVLFLDRTKMCEPHATTEQIVSVLWTSVLRCLDVDSFSNPPLCSSDDVVSYIFLPVSNHVKKGICSKTWMGGLCQLRSECSSSRTTVALPLEVASMDGLTDFPLLSVLPLYRALIFINTWI
jgi:hypothetical protein